MHAKLVRPKRKLTAEFAIQHLDCYIKFKKILGVNFEFRHDNSDTDLFNIDTELLKIP